jgi:hypothetical protein
MIGIRRRIGLYGISKFTENFFGLVQACTSEKDGKAL